MLYSINLALRQKSLFSRDFVKTVLAFFWQENVRDAAHGSRWVRARGASESRALEAKSVTHLGLDLRLPFLQQLGHHHGPVAARPLADHSPLAQQSDHCIIVWSHLLPKTTHRHLIHWTGQSHRSIKLFGQQLPQGNEMLRKAKGKTKQAKWKNSLYYCFSFVLFLSSIHRLNKSKEKSIKGNPFHDFTSWPSLLCPEPKMRL